MDDEKELPPGQAKILEEIRATRERGANGRFKRADREITQPVQNELRSSSTVNQSDGAENRETRGENGISVDQVRGDRGATGNDDRGYGHDNRTPGQSNGRDSSSNTGDSRQIQPGQRVEEKPQGFKAIPSTQEQAQRPQETAAPPKRKHRKKVPSAQEAASQVVEKVKQIADQAPQEEAPRPLLGIFKGGRAKQPSRNRPLSEAEARELQPQLISALLQYFDISDDIIQATVRGHDRHIIWSSIDQEDAEILADAMLSRARKSPTMAARVVMAVDTHRNLRVGLILLPRFYQTFSLYMEHGISLKQ